MEQKSTEELREHMLWTYYGLRVGLVLIGFLLPVLVLGAAHLRHAEWQPTLSDYYNLDIGTFLAPRDFFVGGLLAAGACLYLYKGYSDKENIALNLAGGAAAVVAFFPTGGVVGTIHVTAALFFFFCIAYVCLRRANDTLEAGHLSKEKQARFARSYQILGYLMWILPVSAAAMWWFLQPWVLLAEVLGVWVFAGYWGVKTLEMHASEAEKETLKGNFKRSNEKIVRAA